jgi:hypothetical protein
LVACTPTAICAERLVDWDAWQVDSLHGGPNNRQTRRLCRKGVNLVGALPDIAKEAFNRIGTTNIAMHDWWKCIKRQEMFSIIHQAAHRFGVVYGLPTS